MRMVRPLSVLLLTFLCFSAGPATQSISLAPDDFDFKVLLGDPPVDGSLQQKQEIEELLELQAHRTPEEIERLDIPPGTPVAEHIRTGYTRTDVAVRVMISIIPGDAMILEYKIPT